MKPLNQISGISERRLEALRQCGIASPLDMLLFAPNRYLDRTSVRPVSAATDGLTATFAGVVTAAHDIRSGRRSRFEAVLSDGPGRITGVWFHGATWVRKQLQPGVKAAFFGTVKRFGRSLSIVHPDFEVLDEADDLDGFSRIIPVYPSPKPLAEAGIRSGLLSRWNAEILAHFPDTDPLPEQVLQAFGFPRQSEALRMLHQPRSRNDIERARSRLAFQELFMFQAALVKLKQVTRSRQPGAVFSSSAPRTRDFFNVHLPFTLTEGQRLALSEIKQDLRTGFQMNRLVQGDVGAGKTLVAVGSILLALDNGFQAAFMAPTELLAEQHFRTLSTLLAPLSINMRLLTGSQTPAVRQDVLTAVAGGQCELLIGTHALIQEQVRFFNLGLAVVDEQHRFGVAQRQQLSEKGNNPHILVMSATPIPRSLAMTAYGHLDVSVVKGLPSGRQPVRTVVARETDRAQLYQEMSVALGRGEQVFIVYPLIEASESLDLKSATYGFEQYAKAFPHWNTALLHGRMKKDERDRIMTSFLKKEFQILVSTTVIEVGIDIPNATLMIIEHAERFGLAQLHQLRGRVGRGGLQSACILVAGKAVSADGWQRLRMMERTNDGFEIAEADLKLRGPGDFLGTKQSGVPDFRFADLIDDQGLLIKARETAEDLFRSDPDLAAAENAGFRRALDAYIAERNELLNA